MYTGLVTVVLAAGALLLVIAIVLRFVAHRTVRSADDPAAATSAAPADEGTGLGVLLDALLADADRLAAAALITDLDERGTIAVRAPESGKAPAIEVLAPRTVVVEGVATSSLDDDELAVLEAYLGSSLPERTAHSAVIAPSRLRDTRRTRIAEALDATGWTLSSRELTGMPLRWPSKLIVALAMIGIVVGVLALILVLPDPVGIVISAAAVVAFAAALAVVPVRLRRARPAADPRRRELAALRALARSDGAAAVTSGRLSKAHLVLFAPRASLEGLTVGPDAVPLADLVRAADSGNPRWRIAYDFIDFASFFNRAS